MEEQTSINFSLILDKSKDLKIRLKTLHNIAKIHKYSKEKLAKFYNFHHTEVFELLYRGLLK